MISLYKILNYFQTLNNKKQRIFMVAIIMKGGNILSIGYNDYNRLQYSFKKENKYNNSAGLHAEMSAIKKCSKTQLKGATIMVWGVSKAGNFILTRPCESCRNAIKKVEIKKIIYFDKKNNKNIEKI